MNDTPSFTLSLVILSEAKNLIISSYARSFALLRMTKSHFDTPSGLAESPSSCDKIFCRSFFIKPPKESHFLCKFAVNYKTDTWKQYPNSTPTTSRSILLHIRPSTY